MTETQDVQGKALLSYWLGNDAVSLLLYNNYGEPEEMPVEVFFRDGQSMPEIELYALKCCKGKVLDIGAGVGSHALILQNQGFEVTALELSPLCCKIMQDRGVKQVVQENIFNYEGEKFDTILLLMNGIGLAGTMANLEILLGKCKSLLKPEGQLIFDSSDITYLYEQGLPVDRYYGEIDYSFDFEGLRGEWFKWLYVDPLALKKTAHSLGWKMQIIYENNEDQYLARLTL